MKTSIEKKTTAASVTKDKKSFRIPFPSNINMTQIMIGLLIVA